MFTLIVIAISVLFKKIIQIHKEINGLWHYYLLNLLKFKIFKYKNPKGRLELHDIFRGTPRDCGYCPFPEENHYALPKKDNDENLFIYGCNSKERTVIQIYLKRRPIRNENVSAKEDNIMPSKDKVEIKLKIDDGNGNIYWLDEESVNESNPNQYYGSGFSFEIIRAFKTDRIKFRGYLHRNDDDKLCFVKIRFLCLYYTKIFDHGCTFDQYFLAREVSGCSKVDLETLLEDKIEQIGEIKGTIKVENEEENEMFFLATVGRRFLPKSTVSRRVIKIFGTAQNGMSFQIGCVIVNGTTCYRYGFVEKFGNAFKLLQDITLSKDNFKEIKHKKSFQFEAKFEDMGKEISFVVSDYKDNYRTFTINGIEGICFIEDQVFSEQKSHAKPYQCFSPEKILLSAKDEYLALSFSDKYAPLVELTGGKGASLAQLKLLSEQMSSDQTNKFLVPNGLVATTLAFQRQLKCVPDFDTKLKSLCEIVYDTNSSRSTVKSHCDSFCDWFGQHKLETSNQKQIENKIKEVFGDDFVNKSFAVRSSAAMEDSSEMSAAGQMTTYLGVRGQDAIFDAVVKCWASQFAFVPIEYKRGYGQELCSPMAVVIQEMVDCDSAGVIFTCNPNDGDERLLTITSNFGLGESVVSASADPDTFELSVEIEKNSYNYERKIGSIVKTIIGKKTLVTRLSKDTSTGDLDSGVYNETIVDNTSTASLTSEQVIKLGQISLKIQKHYGNARDIEFGMKNNQICIFQSRPITNLDSGFTDYELMHEMDTPHMSEQDIYSRAHWGENFPGASSWVACYFFLHDSTFAKQQIKQGQLKVSDYNPYRSPMGFLCNQLMFNMTYGPFMKIFEKYPEDDFGVASILAFFGHHITDEEILKSIKDQFDYDKKKTFKQRLLEPIFMLYMLFFAHKKIPNIKHELFDLNNGSIVEEMESIPLEKKVDFMFKKMEKNSKHMDVHGPVSFASSMKSTLLMKLLRNSKDNSNLESDVNLLLSHCNDVVSADVPNTLREIARAIEDKNLFKNLSETEALKFLKSGKNKASELFSHFIKKHAHRGYREFDPLYLPWGQNPIPCIQVIQTMIRNDASLLPKKEKSIDQVLCEIKTPLSWWKRLLIKHWVLPWCRDAVGYRENTKSIIVKCQSYIRDAMWQIADAMTKEGILPETDLLFYLKIDEIIRLSTGERNPLLVMKAKQRKRIYPKMNALKFDEFIKGFRMKPRQNKKERLVLYQDSTVLKGTAVTVGDVKARVCVAENIEDAVNIQQGDILITYSTDIGWSPYFPLISGIVTEIGGTISHGAVIAREYGIPCLIAVENACSVFRTGDIAFLDTRAATIVKIKE